MRKSSKGSKASVKVEQPPGESRDVMYPGDCGSVRDYMSVLTVCSCWRRAWREGEGRQWNDGENQTWRRPAARQESGEQGLFLITSISFLFFTCEMCRSEWILGVDLLSVVGSDAFWVIISSPSPHSLLCSAAESHSKSKSIDVSIRMWCHCFPTPASWDKHPHMYTHTIAFNSSVSMEEH